MSETSFSSASSGHIQPGSHAFLHFLRVRLGGQPHPAIEDFHPLTCPHLKAIIHFNHLPGSCAFKLSLNTIDRWGGCAQAIHPVPPAGIRPQYLSATPRMGRSTENNPQGRRPHIDGKRELIKGFKLQPRFLRVRRGSNFGFVHGHRGKDQAGRGVS